MFLGNRHFKNRKKMDSFLRNFYSNLPLKIINGKPITG